VGAEEVEGALDSRRNPNPEGAVRGPLSKRQIFFKGVFLFGRKEGSGQKRRIFFLH